MSTLIKFDFKELKQLTTNKQSCVVEKTITQNLALDPWCLGNLKESIKNKLDHKIGKFDKEFNGILMSFKNLRILQNVGAIRNDNSEVNFQVQADYFVFQPYVGATLKGIVVKKNVTHLLVLLYRVFNVVIPRPTEEYGNTWPGLNILENQEVTFKIAVFDLYGALPYIRGELDERCIKLVHSGVDESVEPRHNKINDESHQLDKPVSPAKNHNGHNKFSVKKNIPIDDRSVYQTQSPGEIDVKLHTLKNKNKRHKELSQKFCDSDIKPIVPKSKHLKYIDG